jgi:2-dehydro-3-deoxy-D-pentonate aldolase
MKLKGIIPPMITPLQDADTLDISGLERLIEHMIRGGIHGIFALGTTGEGPCLSYRLRADVIKQVCKFVNGRIPVLVSVTDTASTESIKLSGIAADAGADAVVIGTPYYFTIGQAELIQHIEKLVPQLALPAMLYNIPSFMKTWFEIETLRRLSSIEPILGVKDSCGDMNYFAKLCGLASQRPDWSFFIGPEDKMIASISLGGSGGVNGGANVFPGLYVAAYESAVSGDSLRSERLQKLIEGFGRIYQIGKYDSRQVKATKCAAAIQGLCGDTMAEPFQSFNPEDRKQVESILESLNLTSL